MINTSGYVRVDDGTEPVDWEKGAVYTASTFDDGGMMVVNIKTGDIIYTENDEWCDNINLEVKSAGKLKIRIGKITPLKFDGN